MNGDFAAVLVEWQRRCGRHGLPWQVDDAYAVWLSEIMLQQTQVATVCSYYPRFLAAFPTVADLAAADEDEVLALWAGLGYYSRARHLHAAAKQVVSQYGGRFPQTRVQLEGLKGVGRSTAAAVAAFAFRQREAILDGNVKRVLCRVFGRDGDAGDKAFEAELWALAESLLPSAADMPAYTQGLMDLGALVCRRSRPLCGECPMRGRCVAFSENRTAELPRRKTAAAVKEITLCWLVLFDGTGAVWLEKRPQRGIWGGLYCVPCFDGEAALGEAAAAFGIGAGALRAHGEFTHRLTHRLLRIRPFSARVARFSAAAADGVWGGAAEYGLPKPLAAWLAEGRSERGFQVA